MWNFFFAKIWKKKILDFCGGGLFSIFKSPVSGKENIWFPDCPDFEHLPDFQTGGDVR